MSLQILLKSILCLGMILGTGQVAGVRSPEASTAQPTTEPIKENAVKLCHVEVTMLGKTSDIKGMQWPDDLDRWLSYSVEEPCDLILHLPTGKTLTMRIPPILIVSQMEGSVVTVQVPVGKKEAWLAERAREMEKTLAAWHAVPSKRMQASIEEFKHIGPPGPNDGVPLAGIERVGAASLDEHTDLLFELVMGRGGKWSMVAVISAKQKDREPLFREWQTRMARLAAAATKSTSHPSTQP
jgi:hypothetical protein